MDACASEGNLRLLANKLIELEIVDTISHEMVGGILKKRQRTKKEFTRFMQNLAKKYPTAKKIRVVLDNLNTHNESAFYENLPAEEALALAQRFEFYYTSKSASWLNMIEIEFSALSR